MIFASRKYVLRADHEAALERERTHTDAWREACHEQRENNRALVQQIVDLKHAGYQKPEEKPELPKAPDLTPSDYAIENRVEQAPAVQRARLRRYLLTWRDGERKRGTLNEEGLAQAIEHWNSAAEDEDG